MAAAESESELPAWLTERFPSPSAQVGTWAEGHRGETVGWAVADCGLLPERVVVLPPVLPSLADSLRARLARAPFMYADALCGRRPRASGRSARAFLS